MIYMKNGPMESITPIFQIIFEQRNHHVLDDEKFYYLKCIGESALNLNE